MLSSLLAQVEDHSSILRLKSIEVYVQIQIWVVVFDLQLFDALLLQIVGAGLESAAVVATGLAPSNVTASFSIFSGRELFPHPFIFGQKPSG